MADFTVEHWPLDRLQANPDNYRHHPEAQVAQLQKSLQQFGVFKNVVATPEGLVLAGHGVVAAAMQEGLDTLPVYVFAGSEDEQRRTDIDWDALEAAGPNEYGMKLRKVK
jgi:ParB-like chromosome segregation protein Spo0J